MNLHSQINMVAKVDLKFVSLISLRQNGERERGRLVRRTEREGERKKRDKGDRRGRNAAGYRPFSGEAIPRIVRPVAEVGAAAGILISADPGLSRSAEGSGLAGNPLHAMLGQQMASGVFSPVSATQVGSYFLRQYYHVLQQQPEFGHQFYTDLSSVMHIDGDKSHTASGVMDIHALITSLKFTGIEIKTAHSLESWSGGVLVMVSGLVRTEESSGRRRFVETFFLAPQEKGYFVLNDILHFHEEEEHPQPTSIEHNNFETTISASAPITEPDASESAPEGQDEETETTIPVHSEEIETVDKYTVAEPQNIPEADDQEEEIPVDEPPPVNEPIREPPKHTYASILRAAKGQPSVPVPSQTAVIRTQPSRPSSNSTEAEDAAVLDDEAEVKSVYVRNLPSSAMASELEEEFRSFGRIKPDGVLIKTRKDAGVYYAFVEFEDLSGVQNAVKASPISFGGRQIYVEERRPGSLAPRGRSGRGRGGRGGGYPAEPPRGRTAGGGEYGGGRVRGNEYSSGQRLPRQDRGIFGS